MTRSILIVGLGNPGPQYFMNRHNVGFLCVDQLIKDYALSPQVRKDILTAEGRIEDVGVMVAKPQTYMNLSGQPLQKLMAFYKVPLEHIIVIHDDIDLAPGVLKIKQGGGAGGHNGLRSLDAHVGPHYWRLRIGVGRPMGRQDVSDYVLSNFTTDEQIEVGLLLERISKAMPLLLHQQNNLFLQQINQKG